MLKKSVLIVFCLLVSLSGFAQDIKYNIKRINANYTDTSSFKVDMRVRLYEDNKIIESLSYEYIQNKKLSYFNVAGIATVLLEDYILILDERMKYLLLTSRNTDGSITTAYDTLIDVADEIDEKVIDSGNYCYVLSFNDLSYTKIEIFFNPLFFTLTKVKIYYAVDTNLREPSDKVLEFIYGLPKELTEGDKDKVTRETYLNLVNNTLQLSNKFSEYELIDNRIQ